MLCTYASCHTDSLSAQPPSAGPCTRSTRRRASRHDRQWDGMASVRVGPCALGGGVCWTERAREGVGWATHRRASEGPGGVEAAAAHLCVCVPPTPPPMRECADKEHRRPNRVSGRWYLGALGLRAVAAAGGGRAGLEVAAVLAHAGERHGGPHVGLVAAAAVRRALRAHVRLRVACTSTRTGRDGSPSAHPATLIC